jgi:hypothetical protein
MGGSWLCGWAYPLLPGFAADSNDPGWTAASTTALCICCGWSAFTRTRDGRSCYRMGCSALQVWRSGAVLLEDWRPSASTAGPDVSGVGPLGDGRGRVLLPLGGVLVAVSGRRSQ